MKAAASRVRSFHRFAALAGLLSVAVIAGLNFAASRVDAGMDLTPNRRFSVSDGTRRILGRMEKPLSVTFYISRDRPPRLATLRADIVSRLAGMAAAAGPERFYFSPDRDVVEIADTGAEAPKMAALGITPLSSVSPSHSSLYYSCIRLNYPDAPRPSIIQAPSARDIEYELVSRAVRFQRMRPKPKDALELFRTLKGRFTFTYIYGKPGSSDMPPARATLPDQVLTVLKRITAVNPSIVIETDNDVNSRRRAQSRWVEEKVEVAEGSGAIHYYSTIQITDEYLNLRSVDQIRSTEHLLETVAAYCWDLNKPRERVGVFQSEGRAELSRAEHMLYAAMAPERTLLKFVEQLDYTPISVSINEQEGIPPDVAALLLPRPAGLSERQRYEIEAYLAAGGNVIAFHGDWHIPLLDRAVRVNESYSGGGDLWMAAAPADVLEARRVHGGLAPTLEKYGVASDAASLLLVREGMIPYRVYRPTMSDEQGSFPPPVAVDARLPLIPAATPAPGSGFEEIGAFPLRGATPLTLNHETIAALGLRAEPLLYSPLDAMALVLDPATDEPARLSYLVGEVSDDPSAFIVPAQNPSRRGVTLQHTGRALVGVSLRGRFPFDPNIAPPTFGTADAFAPKAPGAVFVSREGRLIVVSAPDAYEALDYFGWRAGEAPLVGRADRAPFISSLRFLSNALDSCVFGDDLIEVRRALLPAPRKIGDWSARQRLLWTAMNVGLTPTLAILAGLSYWFLRRRRRAMTTAIRP